MTATNSVHAGCARVCLFYFILFYFILFIYFFFFRGRRHEMDIFTTPLLPQGVPHRDADLVSLG